jgi:hypothetical protein
VLSAERFQHLHASKDELRPLKMRGPEGIEKHYTPQSTRRKSAFY